MIIKINSVDQNLVKMTRNLKESQYVEQKSEKHKKNMEEATTAFILHFV